MSCLIKGRPFAATYTEEQDLYIETHYKDLSLKELTKSFNTHYGVERTASSVKGRIESLRKNGRITYTCFQSWSDQEKAILVAYFNKSGAYSVQKRLRTECSSNRSIPSIRTKAVVMKISTENKLIIEEHFTLSELSDMTGMSKLRVQAAIKRCKSVRSRKVSNNVLLCSDSLDRFIESATVKALPESCYEGREVCDILGVSSLLVLNRIARNHPTLRKYRYPVQKEIVTRWGTKATRLYEVSFFSKQQINFIAQRMKQTGFLLIHWKKWLKECPNLPLLLKR